MRVITGNLAIEIAIVAKLRSDSPDCFAQGRVHVALTKGVVDRHDMDTTGGFLIGPIDVLTEIANNFVRKLRFNDEAHGLLAIPLSCLMLLAGEGDELKHTSQKERDEVLLTQMKDAAKPILDKHHKKGKPIEVHFHLKEIKKQLNRWKREWSGRAPAEVRNFFPFEEFFDESSGFAILVTVTCYPDRTYFSVPAGKRELCETPWESFERECMEECGIDVSPATACFRDDPNPDVICSDYTWQVVMHLQDMVNSYYLLHKSSEELVLAARERAAAAPPLLPTVVSSRARTHDPSQAGGWGRERTAGRSDDGAHHARAYDPSQSGGWGRERTAGRSDDGAHHARAYDPSQSGGFRKETAAAGGGTDDKKAGGMWSRGGALPVAASFPVRQDGSTRSDEGRRGFSTK